MMLATIWFILVFVLLGGYAVLDGFDLGVGVLHLLARGDKERRISLNAIGPVWDGNEVWLLTGGGALFAAFPAVYATVFSAFHIALMLVLCGLIFRSVSMEFRGKVDSPRWRTFWDAAFCVSSFVLCVLLGVAFGNILRGIPLSASGEFTGSFFALLNPYALLIGLLTLALFTLHGAIYLIGKSSAPMKDRLGRIARRMWGIVVALYVVATVATAFVSPLLIKTMLAHPVAWLVLPVLIAAIAYIPVALRNAAATRAFAASSVLIACMMAIAALSLFPRLVPSITDPAYSLTIYNSSSTRLTLTVMLIIAVIGMPLVIGYTAVIYRVFKGKVILSADSY